jgi:hypothetical protein
MLKYKKFSNFEHIWENHLQQNIDDLYFFDDKLLNEGLIKSWEEDDFIKFLDKILNSLKYHIEIDDETIILRIFDFNKTLNHKGLKRNLFEKIQQLIRQSGYYISGLFNNHFDFSDKYNISFNLVNFININDDKIYMEFNKKFNSEIGIPEYLYHITYPIYIEKIKNNGLIPKSNKIIDNHPDRIYFTSNITDAIKFARSKYVTTNSKDFIDYIILRINTKKLNKIKLYNNPLKIPNTMMFYTNDNIPPYAISIEEENSLSEYARYLKIEKINN